MRARSEYRWGAKHYLSTFDKGEIREYDEYRWGFPWRSLVVIASRMGKMYGMMFRFRTDRETGKRTIERIL